MNNTNIYQRLGVGTIINAKGPATRLSGGLMAAEVADAMREATQYCVDIGALQGRASEIIAQVTGAEAGYVTSGAAAGLLLGTAACVTGADPAKINRLPNAEGMRNRVIMVRSQRNFYDHAVRAAGVEIVEVGLADRYSGAGVRDAEAWEIEAAIDADTACVFFVANPRSRPSLAEVVQVAHNKGVPVLVDAAAQLPPVGNLRAFISAGADLVAFSGGKAIGGPQGSGILCGRRELVGAAALHNLDHDIFFDQWRPPPALFDKETLPGLPQHGIGRACKVGKEQIVGLLTALSLFDESAVSRRHAACTSILDEICTNLKASLQECTHRETNPHSEEPQLRIQPPGFSHAEAMNLVLSLQDGEPSIQVDPSLVDTGAVVIAPSCLRATDAKPIAQRLNALV